jgi:hypothetical protein
MRPTLKTVWTVFLAGTILAVAAGMCGCSDMIIAGLRFAPNEEQKQTAQAADSLAGSLVATGARPGSPAAVALAKMTRPAAVYAGPPKVSIDTSPLAIVEAGQWRYKDDQIAAEKLRGDLRAKTVAIVSERLAGLVEAIGESTAKASAFFDRIAAIAEVAEMGDSLAGSIPDPQSPDETRSPEIDRLAKVLSKAAETIAAAANKQATARPDAGTTADKLLDAADKTIGKTTEVVQRGVGIFEKHSTEIMSLLSVFGLGAGGYAIKKRKDANRATKERDDAVAVGSPLDALDAAANRENALRDEIEKLKKAAIDG